jgi:hypothetical protein
VFAARGRTAPASPRAPLGEVGADQFDRAVEADVLVVVAHRGLGRRSEDRLRQLAGHDAMPAGSAMPQTLPLRW